MSSSLGSGVLTLLHTACGAGILAMPYAFRPFGVLLGFGMIAFCGACSLAGLMIQGRVSKYAAERNASFFALAQVTYPQLSVIFDLAIAVKCFGVGVSYLVVVGDLMPRIFATFTSHGLLLSRNLHITLVMLFVVSPLCFMKRLDSLRYASMVAISSVAYLCVLVLVHYVWPSDEIRELRGHVSLGKPVGSFAALLSCFPIFVFAYTCHHNMFSIVNELRDNSLKGIYKVSIISVALAMSLYLLIGGSGYATFGDNVAGNIIMLYPQSAATTVGRVAIALLVMLAFPLQCHPARASVDHILHYFGAGKSHEAAPSPSSESSQLIPSSDTEDIVVEEGGPRQLAVMPLEGKRFIAITTSILLLSYLLAISVTSLARVLAVVGATGSTSISFILPGIFGFQLIGSEDQPGQSSTKTKFLKYLSLTLACWGMAVLVTCLSATLLLGATH
ncbi:amino acid transporter [Lachancea thermotolerans CBS 6340]|uniref:KLTH0C06006p n=1 Tax=Lachancea thermotolerans (strain ATCC 56472 / CBS 6340 / NRRL Y-8284) TaxID=559295 RepID=C5DE37_LACTC|nr:KLTH0C06006p [Lachancea thermotolerans CBS 6340]CAR22048.1 KLTH0C06006p [Lachancea thermotolerans CBS 6340]